MKNYDLHSPRERLADHRDEKDVGRPGQQEAPVPTVPVHGDLDRPQQVRCALDLVDRDELRKTGDEPVRVELRGAVVARVVEGVEGSCRL